CFRSFMAAAAAMLSSSSRTPARTSRRVAIVIGCASANRSLQNGRCGQPPSRAARIHRGSLQRGFPDHGTVTEHVTLAVTSVPIRSGAAAERTVQLNGPAVGGEAPWQVSKLILKSCPTGIAVNGALSETTARSAWSRSLGTTEVPEGLPLMWLGTGGS